MKIFDISCVDIRMPAPLRRSAASLLAKLEPLVARQDLAPKASNDSHDETVPGYLA